MATKSTIFKAHLQIADIDHSYYADHALTLARHPSETDERMMVRLVALAFNAYQLQATLGGDGQLEFGAGLSHPDDPDVILRDYTGRIRLWIEVGQPEEKPILRACGKADQVLVYSYGHAAEIWWRAIESKLERAKNLAVLRIPTDQARELVTLAARSMQLQATLQEGELTLSSANGSVTIEVLRWK